MEKPKISKQEQQRLVKTYPLFKFDFQTNMARYRSLGIPGLNDVPWQNDKLLREHYLTASIENVLEERYPFLFCSAHIDKSSITISTWIKRSGKDAEGFGEIQNILSPHFHVRMSELNSIAEEACKPSKFYCGGHSAVESRAELGYRYFAGMYCKKYGEDHPNHKQMALSETYD